jgi:hypothetical protein
MLGLNFVRPLRYAVSNSSKVSGSITGYAMFVNRFSSCLQEWMRLVQRGNDLQMQANHAVVWAWSVRT